MLNQKISHHPKLNTNLIIPNPKSLMDFFFTDKSLCTYRRQKACILSQRAHTSRKSNDERYRSAAN